MLPLLLSVLVAMWSCDRSTLSASSHEGEVNMPSFSMAARAFRGHAIRVLGVSELAIAPNGEARLPTSLGGAWAFSAAPVSEPERSVRGWAVANGTVITTKQNLGILLAEAGLWQQPPKDMRDLTKAITWSLGSAYQNESLPEVSFNADGSGLITFLVEHQVGGGGGYVSPETTFQVEIRARADRSAQLTMIEQP